MSEPDRSPIDQALDVLFYAPIGLALNAEELVGQMAVRGRQSVAAAKFIGQMAMHQGRSEVDKALDRIQDQAATLVEQLGQLGASGRVRPAHRRVDAHGRHPGRAGRTARTRRTAPAPRPTVRSQPRPTLALDAEAEAEIPVSEVNRSIPDYDSLAASQVVPRLGGLTDVRARDRAGATRPPIAARTTILNRIAQLQRP